MPVRLDSARIERALGVVAQLIDMDPIYMPIFERLEDELASARAVEAARRRRTVRA